MKKILVMLVVAVSFLITSTVFAQVYPQGMVAYWKFEEVSGAIAYDTVDNNDGQVYDSTLGETGIVGKAIDFTYPGRVRVPYSSDLSLTHAFTLEAWVYPRSLQNDPNFLITKVHAHSSTYTNYALSIAAPNRSNCLQFQMGNPSWSSGYKYYYGSSSILEDEWTHIAVTYDGDTKTFKFFVNGSLDNTITNVPGDPYANTEPVFIGWNSEQTQSNQAFEGLVDEVAIYDRALTLEEIQQHYLNGLDGIGYELPPQFSCIGFEPPMAADLVTVKKNRALPHKAQLQNEEGYAVTGADITAPPVIQVMFNSTGGDPVDVTDDALPAGQGTEGNQFVYTEDGKWQFNLKTSNYTASGTYTVTIISGDDSEYVIDPTCNSSFVIK